MPLTTNTHNQDECSVIVNLTFQRSEIAFPLPIRENFVFPHFTADVAEKRSISRETWTRDQNVLLGRSHDREAHVECMRCAVGLERMLNATSAIRLMSPYLPA